MGGARSQARGMANAFGSVLSHRSCEWTVQAKTAARRRDCTASQGVAGRHPRELADRCRRQGWGPRDLVASAAQPDDCLCCDHWSHGEWKFRHSVGAGQVLTSLEPLFGIAPAWLC